MDTSTLIRWSIEFASFSVFPQPPTVADFPEKVSMLADKLGKQMGVMKGLTGVSSVRIATSGTSL